MRKKSLLLILVILILASYSFALTWSPLPISGTGLHSLYPGPVLNNKLYFGVGGESSGQLYEYVTVSTPITINGFGDNNNVTLKPHPSLFHNEIYVFTENSALGLQVWKSSTGSIGSWVNVGTNGLSYGYYASYIAGSCVFNNGLYVGFSESGTPRLMKNMGDTNWSEITNIPNFFGDIVPEGNYNGYLYVSGGQRLYRYDGTNWQTITTNGFGDVSVFGILPAYQEFQNYIYAGFNSDSGAQIWRSPSGDIGSWSKVFDFNTSDSNNTEIVSFSIPGDGYLYFSTYNTNGTEVWRTAGELSDFEQVNIEGFGNINGKNIACVLSRELFNGLLIAGTEVSSMTNNAALYSTLLSTPTEVTDVLKEEALKILGSDTPGFEGTFVPEEGPLNLSLDGVQFGIVHFRIFTLTGETIFDGEVTSDANGNFQLNLPNDLAAGVYIIRVEGPNFHFTKKLAILE